MDGLTEEDVPVTWLGILEYQITKDHFFRYTVKSINIFKLLVLWHFFLNKTHVKFEEDCKDMFKVVRCG